jgi:phosphatidylinositol alpha-1,6-mannosyltransferase
MPAPDDENGAVSRVPRRLARGRRTGVAALNLWGMIEARRRRVDVVLSAHMVTGPAALAIRRTADVPFVQYVYGYELSARPRLARAVLDRAAAVIAIGAFSEGLAVRHGAAPETLHRILPGVDVAAGQPSNGRSHAPLLVTVSRLAEFYKGHDVVLRALPLIRARIPEVTWAVIGDGPLRAAYIAQAGALGVADSVFFLGSLDAAERDRWLARATVFVMPSRLSAGGAGEGFGIAYLEAGAHGLPVVAGRVGGAVDAVEHGRTGLLVDPTDHVAVAEAVTELLLDPARAAALGSAGRARAAELSWPAAAARVEQVLETVAASR